MFHFDFTTQKLSCDTIDELLSVVPDAKANGISTSAAIAPPTKPTAASKGNGKGKGKGKGGKGGTRVGVRRGWELARHYAEKHNMSPMAARKKLATNPAAKAEAEKLLAKA